MNAEIAPRWLFELVTVVAPLGLRFWDEVSGALLSSALAIAAAPEKQPGRRVMATVSSAGIYGFAHLPGLREFGHGSGDDAFWAGIGEAQRQPFVITVRDDGGRVAPFTLRVDAPQKGVYAFACAGATVTPNAPNGAVPLFSTPSRPVPAGMAVIRSEVSDGGKPAAWALLEVRQTIGGNTTVLGHGLADAQGQAALIFPYPPPTVNASLLEQSWEVDVHIYHAAALNASKVADLCDILQQPHVGQKSAILQYGRESILR